MMGATVATLSGFNGRFASLFPGAYQVVQTDLGLTYGGTMLATGTTPPVITLTGTLVGAPTAITITDTLVGILGTWTGLVTYGDGTTQAFTSAATVPLTGRGTGLTLNIAAGAAAGNNTWQATCAGLADQSGNAKHYSQATGSLQPVISTGLNGKPGILFSGLSASAQCLDSALNLPAPGTTPWTCILVMRMTIHANDAIICSQPTQNGGLIYVNPGNTGLSIYDGTVVASGTNTLASWSRLRAYFSHSTADALKVGSSADLTGSDCGNLAQTGRRLGANGNSGGATNGSKSEFLAAIHVPGIVSLAAFERALNSAAGYGVGSIQV
jgi:hypothetical protein